MLTVAESLGTSRLDSHDSHDIGRPAVMSPLTGDAQLPQCVTTYMCHGQNMVYGSVWFLVIHPTIGILTNVDHGTYRVNLAYNSVLAFFCCPSSPAPVKRGLLLLFTIQFGDIISEPNRLLFNLSWFHQATSPMFLGCHPKLPPKR